MKSKEKEISGFLEKLSQLCKEHEVEIGTGIYGRKNSIVVVYKGIDEEKLFVLEFSGINEKGEIKGVYYDT